MRIPTRKTAKNRKEGKGRPEGKPKEKPLLTTKKIRRTASEECFNGRNTVFQ